MALSEGQLVDFEAEQGTSFSAFLLAQRAMDPGAVADLPNDDQGAVSQILTEEILPEGALAHALSDFRHLPRFDTGTFDPAPSLIQDISEPFLRRHACLPIRQSDDAITVAVVNPFDTFVIDALRFAYAREPELLIATPSEVDAGLDALFERGDASIETLYGEITDLDDGDATHDLDHLRDLASEAPIVRLVSHLITQAAERRASDIHIEPMEGRLRVRYRIDGVLQDVESPPKGASAAVISRIKIMAGLDIAERRLPQDGRIRSALKGSVIDIRVSTTPTRYGESVVMRILDRSSMELDFDRLGFAGTLRHQIEDLVAQPHGILLVTGPTGSGKTTTLYAALSELNQTDRKILTIEDPIEYVIDGVNQSQVQPQIGLTFASALRSFLRQDPDIMMVGEIRDLETAETAVQAALTGHLILATLHTNDAASAMTRLLDMGIDDFLIASTVVGVLAQRLVRRLCPDCRETYAPDAELIGKYHLDRLGGEGLTLYRAKGCEACGQTGYGGRVAIAELLPMTEELRAVLMSKGSATALKSQAMKNGMVPMFEDGLTKALAGLTTLEEVLRVTRDA